MSTYSNRLYDHFQSERSTFSRSLLVVISIAVFFVLVFQPYLATLKGLVELDHELTTQIDSVQREIQTATIGIERATEFMGDASAFQELYEETDTWVDDLDGIELYYDLQSQKLESLRSVLDSVDQAAWHEGSEPATSIIRKLRTTYPEIMSNYNYKDNCFFRIEIDWLRCAINKRLAPLHNRLERVLYDRTESHELTKILETEIRLNREKYESGLSGAIGQAKLSQWVRDYLNKEKKIIRRWYEEVAKKRLQLISEAKKQQKLLTQNKERRINLENRKEEIKQSGKLVTPIGALPLAFLDMLTLLPLILVVTATMLLRSQSRLLKLRQNFQIHGPDEEKGSEALRLTMPIWLNLETSFLTSLFVLLLLMVPSIAAILGIIQLITNPGLSISDLQLDITITGTLAAILVYAIYYFKLFKTWYRNR